MKKWTLIVMTALLGASAAMSATEAAKTKPAALNNKAVVLRMINMVNTHETGKLGEVIAEDFVDHGPTAGGGLAGFKKGVDMMHGSFPNLHFAVEDIMGEGDKVAVRATLNAAFTGKPLFGVPATGKHAKWLTLMTFRIANGKIAERWTNANTWGMLQQVGVLPSPHWDLSSLAVPEARDNAAENKLKKSAREMVEEVWVKRDLDAAVKFFAKDGGVAGEVPAGGSMLLNPSVIKMFGTYVFAAFPDFKASIDYVIAEGNVVVLRISETGTHKAEYMQIAPTNKKVKWSDTFFLVYDKNGKIQKAWLQANLMGLMAQIGGFKPQVPKGDAAKVATGTPAEINKAVFTKFINGFWNERKFDLADELIHPEHFSSSIPTLPKGPKGMKIIAGVVAGGIFPDLKREIVHIFATDDMVGAIWINRGTHKGTYMNIPATGKKVEWIELGIAKMKDGKLLESWYRPDEVGLVKELAPKKLEWLHF